MFAGNPVRMSTRLAAADELYAYQNVTKDVLTKVPGSEYVGFFTVTSAMPVGLIVFNQQLNPLMFPDTRLSSMAKNYSEFRFRRARIVHVPTVGNNVDGALVMNYFPNPDFELGSAPSKVMFATRGYKTPIRTRGSVAATLDSEWRKLDIDSSEIIKTSQGKFVVAIDSATTVAGTMTFNMILEYEVEFRGAARQTTTYGTPSTLVATTCTPTGNNIVSSAAVSPSPSTTAAFLVQPALNVSAQNGVVRTGRFAKFADAQTFNVYESLEELSGDSRIIMNGQPAFASPFLTLTPITVSN
jgi:hypothetical protein